MANVYARSGKQADARKLLADLIAQSKRQYVSPYYFAIVYVAIDWLEQALADRSNGLVFIKVESELDDLRSNPRFVALQRKLNFPIDVWRVQKQKLFY